MDLKELNKKAKYMLANFVDEIGWDGQSYIEANGSTPVAYGEVLFDSLGEYMTPESRRLSNFLKDKKIDSKTEDVIRSKGLILLNKEYKNKEANADLYITLMHEKIHANRNLLIYDVYRDEDFSAFVSDNDKIEQNTDKMSTRYADASQDVLKGSIDDSGKTVDKYMKMDVEDVEEIIDSDEEIPEKLERQKVVDESLANIISTLSYSLYKDKESGKESSIWEKLEKIKAKTEGTDIGYMSEIILKHKDFELFKWMLDPITYSQGDIHYDFFAQYTKNDTDLVDKLYNAERPDLEEDFGALLRMNVKKTEELTGYNEVNKQILDRKNINKDLVK